MVTLEKSFELIQLSKIVSHALRHKPQLYNLKLDNEGWVKISDLIIALENKNFNICQEDLVEMIAKSQKKRHQILDGKIRALYGHSTNEKIIKQCHLPPIVLFHGTTTININEIMATGILPMGRQYVHLSEDEETAKNVAIRRRVDITILKIQAQEAYKNGVLFYKEENNIWLSESIPSIYISL